MTRGGSGGPHEWSGEPHEWSGEPHEWSGELDECCTSGKQWLYGPKTGQELHQMLKEVNCDGYGWVPKGVMGWPIGVRGCPIGVRGAPGQP